MVIHLNPFVIETYARLDGALAFVETMNDAILPVVEEKEHRYLEHLSAEGGWEFGEYAAGLDVLNQTFRTGISFHLDVQGYRTGTDNSTARRIKSYDFFNPEQFGRTLPHVLVTLHSGTPRPRAVSLRSASAGASRIWPPTGSPTRCVHRA